MKTKCKKQNNNSCLRVHLPTVAYLTKVCLLLIMASTAIFSKYWLVMMAMVGCLAASTFGICFTTVTSSCSAWTLVKLFRLCSSV